MSTFSWAQIIYNIMVFPELSPSHVRSRFLFLFFFSVGLSIVIFEKISVAFRIETSSFLTLNHTERTTLLVVWRIHDQLQLLIFFNESEMGCNNSLDYNHTSYIRSKIINDIILLIVFNNQLYDHTSRLTHYISTHQCYYVEWVVYSLRVRIGQCTYMVIAGIVLQGHNCFLFL